MAFENKRGIDHFDRDAILEGMMTQRSEKRQAQRADITKEEHGSQSTCLAHGQDPGRGRLEPVDRSGEIFLPSRLCPQDLIFNR